MATKLPRITYEDKKDYKVIEQDPTYCISAKDMNDIKNTFNQSAGMIEKAVDTTNQTNQTINDKIEDGSFIPQATAGTVEMTQPGTKAEVTITGDKKNPEFNFKIPKDEIDDSEDIKKALLQGTYTTDLSEEYKGVASDFGSEILKIEGKSEQVTTNGYQLFDASKLQTKTQGGATVTNNGDGSFTVSGSGSLNDNCRLHKSISNIKASDYFKVGKLTFNADGITYPRVFFQLWEDGVENLFNIDLNGKTSGSVEITQDMLNRGNKIEFGIVGSTNQPIKAGTIKPMLYQEGDGTWEPFTGGMPSPNPNYPQEIRNALDEPLVSVGRNLFDASKLQTKTQGGATVTNNGDGSFTVSGSGNLTQNFSLSYTLETPSEVKKLFKVGDLNLVNGNANGVPYFEIAILANGKTNYLRNGTIQITDEMMNASDLRLDVVVYGKSGLAIKGATFKPMLYQDGDGIWEPFKYAETNLNFQRMCSLADGTCDTYENGVSTQRIGVYDFNGHSREDWKIDKTYTDCTRFYIVKNDIKRRNDYTNSIMCNRLKTLTSHTTKDKGISSYTNSDYPNQNWIYVNGFNEFTTVEQFKEWLENNPINIQYELETPITEKVELPIVQTFYPYTNIYQVDDVKAKIQYGLRSKVEECPYDIGDLYITLNDTLPSVKWKGTKWERVEGLVPVGYKESDADFGTLGKTGGAKTVTLTEEQIPEHGHQAKAKKAGNHKHGIALKTATGSATPHTGAGIKEGSWSSTDTHAWLDKGLCEELGEHDHVITVENAGGSKAHSNLQPYKVFNMWLRTK